MSSTLVRSENSREVAARRREVDMRLEVVVIPVSNVDQAKLFYTNLGWRLDADFAVGNEFRVVQFTPPGSACSIHFGTGATSALPGSASGLWLVVPDIVAARAELIDRGAAVGEIFHRAGPGKPPVSGLDPERRSYFSYVTFSDPDGNSWLLQEVTARFPGRVGTDNVTFNSSSELVAALGRAATAHGEHEKSATGKTHEDWAGWYAEFMFAEQTGKPLPT
jgi:catechol 2,3-dioxygenase-like lactoylglutathione lyase family enzyme